MTENHSPLEQFTIKRIFDLNLGGIDVSFTNSAAFMIVSIILIGSLMILGTRKKLLIPNRWQNLVEITYELVAKTVRDNIGDEGKKFFPFKSSKTAIASFLPFRACKWLCFGLDGNIFQIILVNVQKRKTK